MGTPRRWLSNGYLSPGNKGTKCLSLDRCSSRRLCIGESQGGRTYNSTKTESMECDEAGQGTVVLLSPDRNTKIFILEVTLTVMLQLSRSANSCESVRPRTRIVVDLLPRTIGDYSLIFGYLPLMDSMNHS